MVVELSLLFTALPPQAGKSTVADPKRAMKKRFCQKEVFTGSSVFWGFGPIGGLGLFYRNSGLKGSEKEKTE
jgi:hypothetical protein